jgi:hypothetical protein
MVLNGFTLIWQLLNLLLLVLWIALVAAAYKPLTPLSLPESAQIRWLYAAVDEVLAGASPEEALGNAQRQAQR